MQQMYAFSLHCVCALLTFCVCVCARTRACVVWLFFRLSTMYLLSSNSTTWPCTLWLTSFTPATQLASCRHRQELFLHTKKRPKRMHVSSWSLKLADTCCLPSTRESYHATVWVRLPALHNVFSFYFFFYCDASY